MPKVELLSPAKDKETAFAAIDCGADAIYIGAPAFGARKAVPNSIEDIADVVKYAHKFWAKVYVTLNTILTDNELTTAVELVKELDSIGVDAIIIQDLGLLNKLIDLKLGIHVHMSTQCDNYLPEKVKFFNDIGVSRVILARELSIEQIKNIHKLNPNLELESFVHGALCVSMSGQCYLSQYIGGRSANRGECAQPCRKLYSVITEDGKVLKKDIRALCLKDFNASEQLDKIINAGIISLKIEGRLKDIEYVKNITSYYAQKLEKKASSGKSKYPFEANPEKSFNRGFTEYFLNGRCDCFNFESAKSKGEFIGTVVDVKEKCFKISTDKKLHPQDGIYCKNSGFLVNKVDGNWVYPNKPVYLKKGDKIYRNQDVEFDKLLKLPVKRQIGVFIEIKNSVISVTDEDNVKVSIEIPHGEKANNPEKIKDNFRNQLSKTGESDFYVEDIKIDSELPFLPISEINRLRRDLLEKLTEERLKIYNRNKRPQTPMNYVQYYSDNVDYRANIHNSSAEDFYRKCGVKEIEYSFESKQPNRQVELMRCKHCIKYALNMCKSPQKLVLQDEYGKKFQLRFNCKNCEMSVLRPQ